MYADKFGSFSDVSMKMGIDYERQRKRRQQTESLRLPNFEHTGGHIPSTYCNFTRPRHSDYFEGKSGLFWNFGVLSSFIFKRRKDLWGLPAIAQIKAIGLDSEFTGGFTPRQLPGTFVSKTGINND